MASRQQNFRLEEGLIAGLEAAVASGRAGSKNGAVSEAVARWLASPDAPAVSTGWGGVVSLPEGFGALEPDRDIWSRVVNPAELGSLLRLEDTSRIKRGFLLLVERTGELLVVRDGRSGVLAVERGFGSATGDIQNGGGTPAASAIQVGDVVRVVGREIETSEASPVGATTIAPNLSGGDGGERGAVSAPAVAEGQGSGDGSASGPGPSLPLGSARLEGEEARADGELERAAAASAADRGVAPASDRVELAPWLAGKTGVPAAVCRAKISGGRVSIRGGSFLGTHVSRGDLEHVAVDGRPV